MPCKYPKYRSSAGCVVACGQCGSCLRKKQREKSARVLLESKTGSEHVLFITLTYDNDHLPISYTHKSKSTIPGSNLKIETTYKCPTGTLSRTHIVNFIKRLRRQAQYHHSYRLRHVYCGEYGEISNRPHYHLILWGLPYKDRQLIYDCWTLSHPALLDIQIPKNERHLANYLSKYILSPKKRKNEASLNGAYPEFYVTSKGLGLQYASSVAKALSKESGLINLWMAGAIPSNFFLMAKIFQWTVT